MRHCEFYSVLQALRRTAEMAVARGFCDQEKDEKRFRTRSMYSSRGDALRLAAATRLEVNPRSQPHPAPIVRFHTSW